MLSRSSNRCRHLILPHIKQISQNNTAPQIKTLNPGMMLLMSNKTTKSVHSSNSNQSKTNLALEDESSADMYVSPDSNQCLKSLAVVPGKGPPPEPPVECCMSGCANCVWIAYAESLKEYYSDGGKAARDALEQIENPSLKMFVKLEMGLL